MIKVFPSLLSADFLILREEIAKAENAKVDSLHLDIMDGNFVPNLTFGPFIISQIRKITTLPLDAHLMIRNVEDCIDSYIDAGVNSITVHVEACTHLERLIKKIQSWGVKVGVALNPTTHESCLEYLYDCVDSILVMTVNPGFAGQKFIVSQLRKISEIKKKVAESKRDIEIAVDGGVDAYTASLLVEHGATILIAGSYLFSDGEGFADKVHFLRKLGTQHIE